MTDAREPQLPPALSNELEQLWSPGPPPDRVREALRSAAKDQLVPSSRTWKPVLLAGLGAAAAGLTAMVWFQGRPDRATTQGLFLRIPVAGVPGGAEAPFRRGASPRPRRGRRPARSARRRSS